jgi:MFS family permease
VAFILYAIALIAVAFTPSLPLLVLPAILFGVAQGINLPNVFSLLNAHAPTENPARSWPQTVCPSAPARRLALCLWPLPQVRSA